jgi:hypothetical protein
MGASPQTPGLAALESSPQEEDRPPRQWPPQGQRSVTALAVYHFPSLFLLQAVFLYPKSAENGFAFQLTSPQLNGALPQAYPNNSNHASDYACVVFIFFFSFGYSVGFGPNAWVYGTEIFPTHVRAKGLNIAASAGAIGSIVVAQIWPVAIQNIGAQTYFIFFAINAVSVGVLWVWYPETKGRSLEKMDGLFEGSGSGSEGDVEAVGGEKEKREEVGVCEVPSLAEKN